jgi:hypothetical protein
VIQKKSTTSCNIEEIISQPEQTSTLLVTLSFSFFALKNDSLNSSNLHKEERKKNHHEHNVKYIRRKKNTNNKLIPYILFQRKKDYANISLKIFFYSKC